MVLGTSLDSLQRHFPRSIDLSLGRMRRLLALIGHPERHLPPVVHVAGTNGKGSVIAFLRSILAGAGYRVHVYTSPHLVRFNERIRIAGQLIKDKELEFSLEICVKANQDKAITFFEMTTAAAFLSFARTPASLVLVETGLGGRLDATNLIPQPYLTVLTPVSIDHQCYLGRGLVEIAGEKAGILKFGRPAVVSAQTRPVLGAITRAARARATPLWRQNYEWRLNHRKFGTIFESLVTRRLLPVPSLIGNHQRKNAGLAVASLDQMPDFSVSSSAVRQGLISTRWPGRLQRLAPGPLTRTIPPAVQVWVDGGHNAAAGVALAEVARQYFCGYSLQLIVGMLKSKSLEEFLSPLVPFVERFWGITIPGESDSIPANVLTGRAQCLGLLAEQAPDLETAVKSASVTASRILICGSLYLAGHTLAANNEAPT